MLWFILEPDDLVSMKLAAHIDRPERMNVNLNAG